jgi:hypothetical protein
VNAVPGDIENVTVVPSEYFDELLADLDAPAEPNERTRAAHRRLRSLVRIDEGVHRDTEGSAT